MNNSILNYLFLLFAFSGYLIIAGCSESNQQNSTNPLLIAEVDDDFQIHFPRLQQYYADHEFGARFPDSDLHGYEETLEILITNRLKHMDFFDTGMHRDPDLRREIQKIVSEEIYNQYFEEVHLSNYINETTKREYYEGLKKEIFFRQIVLPKSLQQEGDRQTIDDTIEDILDALSEGEEFSRLINLYSHGQNPHNVSSIRWNPERTSPLFNQLYNLSEGDVKVLETANSFLVILIDRIEPVDVPAYEYVETEIDRNLRTMHGNRAMNEFQDEQRKIVNRDQIEWNRDGLEQLATWTKAPGFFQNYRDTLRKALNEGRNFTILTYKQDTVDVEEYMRLLDEILIMSNSGQSGIEQHQDFLIEALRRDQIVKKGMEMGLDENVLTIQNQSPTLRNQAILLYNQQKIDRKIPEPGEDKLHEFYQAYRDSIFYEPTKVNIFALIYDDIKLAEDAIKRYEDGTEFENIEQGYAVRTFIKTRDGEIESFMRNEPPYLGEAAFSIREGEVYGPIEYDHSEHGKQYAVIKSVNNQPDYYISFEEDKERVAEEYKIFHRKKISDSVKHSLWEKYPVSIFEENLKQNISRSN